MPGNQALQRRVEALEGQIKSQMDSSKRIEALEASVSQQRNFLEAHNQCVANKLVPSQNNLITQVAKLQATPPPLRVELGNLPNKSQGAQRIANPPTLPHKVAPKEVTSVELPPTLPVLQTPKEMVALTLNKVKMGQLLSQVPPKVPQVENHNEETPSEISLPETNFQKTKPDSYATRELCKSLIGEPSWDGKSLSWKNFMKDWKAFWSIQKDLVGYKNKKWLFLKCLPTRWRTHMKANVHDANWDFREISEFLKQQCDIMVPDWKKTNQWKACMPTGPTYVDYLHWWLTWLRLGKECDLRDQDWIHQYNSSLNHRGFYHAYLEEIVQMELVGGAMSLEVRHQYVLTRLQAAYKAQETMYEMGASLGNTQRSPQSTCYHCGKPGHWSSNCPNKSKGRPSTYGLKGYGGRTSQYPGQKAGGGRGYTYPPAPHQGKGTYAKGQYNKPNAYGPYTHGNGNIPFAHGFNQTHGSGIIPHTQGNNTHGAKRKGSFPSKGKSYSKPSQGRISDTEKQRRRDLGLCMHCGQKGHTWRDCPIGKSLGDRKFAPQRHIAAPASEGKFKGTSKGGRPKGTVPFTKGKGAKGRGITSRPMRALDAQEDFDDQEYDEEEESWEEENLLDGWYEEEGEEYYQEYYPEYSDGVQEDTSYDEHNIYDETAHDEDETEEYELYVTDEPSEEPPETFEV